MGQNLRDHPKVEVTWRTKPGFELNGLIPREQLSLRYTADGSELRNDMKISMISFATGRADEDGDRMVPLGIRMSSGIQLAAGAGELLLTSTDPNVQPQLDYHYVEDPFDQRRLRDLVRLSVELGEHAEFQNIIGERIEPLDSDLVSDEALDDWVARRVSTSQHISRHLQNGAIVGPYGSGRSIRQGSRFARTEGGGCVYNARLHPGQHQRHVYDDRRAYCGLRSRGPLGLATATVCEVGYNYWIGECTASTATRPSSFRPFGGRRIQEGLRLQRRRSQEADVSGFWSPPESCMLVATSTTADEKCTWYVAPSGARSLLPGFSSRLRFLAASGWCRNDTFGVMPRARTAGCLPRKIRDGSCF